MMINIYKEKYGIIKYARKCMKWRKKLKKIYDLLIYSFNRMEFSYENL